jgi:glyoxylase-like metal-dependent hydrolase (beta-lactamase superfamily II)
VKVEMRHFRNGHIRGYTFVYFPDLKVVHTGDVVVEGMPHFDYTDGGSAVGWVEEIYDLRRHYRSRKITFGWQSALRSGWDCGNT